MVDQKAAVPLMVTPDEDIQYVEEDNDTVSETEPSTGIKRHSGNGSQAAEDVYIELPLREKFRHLLRVPKPTIISRSISSESSDGGASILVRSGSVKKKHHHECEKASGASSAPKKKISLERIADGSFFRRRHETYEVKRSDKGDDEEHILEALRHIVRKCTTTDPVKRPCSTDVLDLLSTYTDKS